MWKPQWYDVQHQIKSSEEMALNSCLNFENWQDPKEFVPSVLDAKMDGSLNWLLHIVIIIKGGQSDFGAIM